ncbi:hypothetical protein B0E34_20940, partial [Chryseobacterium mucoviscidosis]
HRAKNSNHLIIVNTDLSKKLTYCILFLNKVDMICIKIKNIIVRNQIFNAIVISTAIVPL